jgi:hypothetical protein
MCGIAGLIHRGKSGDVGQEMTAMLQSLGPPQLPGGDTIAVHYFAAVYQKGIRDLTRSNAELNQQLLRISAQQADAVADRCRLSRV